MEALIEKPHIFARTCYCIILGIKQSLVPLDKRDPIILLAKSFSESLILDAPCSLVLLKVFSTLWFLLYNSNFKKTVFLSYRLRVIK